MTPLEFGLGGGLTLLVVGGWWSGSVGVWWGAWWCATAAAVLGWTPLGMYLVDWSTAPAGAVVVPAPVVYTTGAVGGGPLWGDLRCLLVVLWAGAAAVGAARRQTEPVLLAGIATTAAAVTVTTDHTVVLYLGLELQALAVYTLVGFYRFDDERTEAALRYLLLGSAVSGFMVLAWAVGYHTHGTVYLHEYHTHGVPWLTGVLLFKLGLFPFHWWTPPVYTPLEWSTLAVVVGAGKVNLWYLLTTTVAPHVGATAVVTAAVGSVVVGAVGGFFQTTVTGVLAYSGVINGGYILLLWVGGTSFQVGYYLGVYLWTTAVVVATAAAWPTTGLLGFRQWGGLGVATPLVLYYLVLNLGGLPVFPGFFSKLVLLVGILDLGWATAVAVVAASLVPALYYAGLAGAVLFGGSAPVGAPTGVAIPTVAVYTTVAAAAFGAGCSSMG